MSLLQNYRKGTRFSTKNNYSDVTFILASMRKNINIVNENNIGNIFYKFNVNFSEKTNTIIIYS